LKSFGNIIAKLRKEHGLTQKELGKKLNVSYQAVSKWENNLAEPDLATIEKITDIFKISVSDFFAMTKDPDNIKKYASEKQQDKVNKNFLKLKPWCLVIGLSLIILILSLCAFLIPIKYNSKQIFNKYDSSIFFLSCNTSITKSGTGFFINDSGLAVTVYSNLKNCTTGKIQLNNGKQYDIEKIVGVDDTNNLALIQIDIKNTKPIDIGNSNDIKMGDKVYSITYSSTDRLDDCNSKITEGIIFKVESDSEGTSSIQTTASIEDSNKGGVLFNEYGKVIGIISSQLNISGVGFDMVNVCVPINKISKIEKNINVSLEEYINNPYTLTFKNSDDKVLDTKVVKKGFVLEKYEKSGYIISGLYTDKEFETPFNLNEAIISSLDIYVDLRPIEYTIVFDGNGAEGVMSSQTFKYDEEMSLKKCSFYIENKMFSYWSRKGLKYNDEEQILNLTTKDKTVITLTAVWEDLKFTINFNSNGGSGNMNSDSYLYNATYTIPENKFYKTGYNFSHWECNGEVYESGQVIGKISDDQIIFDFKAIWTPITYTIKYRYSTNYTFTAGTATYDEDFTLINCTYENQDIDYLTYNGETYEVGDAVKNLATLNKTIYFDITWKGVDFKIKYFTDDVNYQIYDYTWGVNKYLKGSSWFSKIGYYCSGFTCEKYKNEIFSAGEYFYDTDYEIRPNEILEFKVLWRPITYYLKINNTSVDDTNITCTYDESFTIPETSDYYVGHTFENYSLKVNGEFIRYVEKGETLINLTSVSGDSVYLIPNWTANKTTMNYYVDGELWKTDIVEYNSYYLFPIYTEEKTDFWFNGWMCNEKFYKPRNYSQVKFLDSEMNLHAFWSKSLKGEGTDESPYLIESYDDLSSLSYLFGNSDFWHKTFKLVNDIDCENRELLAIDNFYYCTFDGNNKVIKNVKLTNSLFDFADNSTIKNLGVENYILEYVGVENKTFSGFINVCIDTTIENCWTVGKINVTCYRKSEMESISIGGFCGWSRDTVIKNCYSQTEITFARSNPNHVTTHTTDIRIGGFIGAYAGVVENCYSIASFNTTDKVSPFISYKEDITITNCFYGSSNQAVGFLDNPELLSGLEYSIQTDTETITTASLEDLYDLSYLNTTLGFDTTIWQANNGSFPTLKTFEVEDEGNN